MKKSSLVLSLLAASIFAAAAQQTVPSPSHSRTTGGEDHDSTYTTAPAASSTPVASGGTASNITLVTENDGAAASYQLPANATSVAVIMHNDVPPIWQGETNWGGSAIYVYYTHYLFVLDSNNNLVQTVVLNQTGGWYGAHWSNTGCYDGWGDCQRGITSYQLNQTDIRGDASATVSPDGAENETSYVWPQTNSSQTATVTLYNVPQLYTLKMQTYLGPLCGSSQEMPDLGQGAWSNFSIPTSCQSQTWPAQGGANTGGAYGDTRYIAPIAVNNQSSWKIDYQVSQQQTTANLPNQSCAAFGHNSQVSGCGWNVPATGNGGTFSNAYNTNDNGTTHTYCSYSAKCGGDLTQQTVSWNSQYDSSQANVADKTSTPPPGRCGSAGEPVCP